MNPGDVSSLGAEKNTLRAPHLSHFWLLVSLLVCNFKDIVCLKHLGKGKGMTVIGGRV